MNKHLISPEEETRDFGNRFKVIYIVIWLVFIIFFCRLWYLQISQGEILRLFSEENRIKKTKILAPRGLIYDRHYRILVENLPGFEATISPQYATKLKETAKAVGKILNMKTSEIIKKVKKSRKQNGPFLPVKIKENLSREEVFFLKRLRINHPGLDINETILRNYSLKENGAQLFGYVGEISKSKIKLFNKKYKGEHIFKRGDIIGKGGIEEAFESEIRGTDGISFLQIDARGRETSIKQIGIYSQYFKDQDAIPGKNILLTIDLDIQKAAFESFQNREKIGALVALKSNGEILSWLSMPSYDPNEFSTGISVELWSKLRNNDQKPLRNKVIQDHHSPGSSFKSFVALAGLQEKIVSPSSIYFCPGYFKFGRRLYHDHIKYGHGNVDVLSAIERSCNVFFYKLGNNLGINKISSYAHLFGLGSKTNIELEGEVPGLIPTEKWKEELKGEPWQPGENLSTAIGQGFVLTTVLQMGMAYLAIGNKGKLFKPFVVKQILSADNKVLREFEPKLLRDITKPNKEDLFISEDVFEIVKQGLWLVGNGDRGTAKWWKIPGVEISGKTGTSQVMSFSSDQIYAKCEERPFNQRHHGWFVGYAPAENPQIVVAVMTEHSCHGSTGSAPIVRDVIKAYMQKYFPEKIEKQVNRKRKL